jgi:hypothetical protein
MEAGAELAQAEEQVQGTEEHAEEVAQRLGARRQQPVDRTPTTDFTEWDTEP